MTGIMQFAL